MNPKLYFTVHAITRFMERWHPEYSFDIARRTLLELSASAKPTRERMPDGKERWLTDADETITLVVARDREYALPTCVTVLPAYEAQEEHESVLRMRHLEELAADRVVREATESGVYVAEAPAFDGWCVCRQSFARHYARKLGEFLCGSCYRDRVDKAISEGKSPRDVLGRVPTVEQYLESLKGRQSAQVAA